MLHCQQKVACGTSDGLHVVVQCNRIFTSQNTPMQHTDF
jgi:hypothetical protein